MPDLVKDMALMLSYAMQDIPDVEPLENSLSEVEKDGLIIKNTMYKAPGLRKMHLELAEIGGIKILHCVFFPDPSYNLPIFGCDVVANNKVVTAAIVDVSPVDGFDTWDEIREISNNFNFSGKRPLPLWGDEIFSPYCKFTRLTEEIDMANFFCLVQNYLVVYLKCIKETKKDTLWINTMKRLDDQIWYCQSQKKNDKTRNILLKYFDEEWVNNYMDNILFDEPTVVNENN
tara:strand:- start:2041 stop:2733 length:693 start_codon:yes stop_codon:yes gene_type:complete